MRWTEIVNGKRQAVEGMAFDSITGHVIEGHTFTNLTYALYGALREMGFDEVYIGEGKLHEIHPPIFEHTRHAFCIETDTHVEMRGYSVHPTIWEGYKLTLNFYICYPKTSVGDSRLELSIKKVDQRDSVTYTKPTWYLVSTFTDILNKVIETTRQGFLMEN